MQVNLNIFPLQNSHDVQLETYMYRNQVNQHGLLREGDVVKINKWIYKWELQYM